MMVNKYGPPAPQSAAVQLAKYPREDGADPSAKPEATLQPSPISAQLSTSGASDSLPAVFHTKADLLTSLDSPTCSEDCNSPGPPSSEPTLAETMLAIKDCKASLTVQMESIHIDFSLLKIDVQNLRE